MHPARAPRASRPAHAAACKDKSAGRREGLAKLQGSDGAGELRGMGIQAEARRLNGGGGVGKEA